MSVLAGIRGALTALAFGATSGCAVLTIDVDVYKGPLINSERMKMEQILAMSVAAKPLLLQLRSMFEGECRSPGKVNNDCVPNWSAPSWCPHIDSFSHTVNGVCLGSWQARRVNAILFLYQDAGTVGKCLRDVGPLISRWAAALGDVREAIFAKGVELGIRKPGDPQTSAAYAELQNDMLRRERSKFPQDIQDLINRDEQRDNGNPEVKRAVENAAQLRRARDAFTDFALPPGQAKSLVISMQSSGRALWLKAARILADNESDLTTCADPAGARNLVADLISVMTDRFELTEFLANEEAAKKVAANLLDIAKTEAALRTPQDFHKEGETIDRSRTVQAALKRALLGVRGQAVAAELLDIQASIIADQNPTGLVTYFNPGSLDRLLDGLDAQLDAIATGFERGRRTKGILALANDYVELDTMADKTLSTVRGSDVSEDEVKRLKVQMSRNRETNREVKRQIRGELLDGLTDFGQKVAHMANLQTLLPNNQDDKGKRIQLLQAIGNSILNQIDDFKKRDSYDDRLRDDRLIRAEIAALKSARNSMTGPIIAELLLDVAKTPKDSPRKEGISAALAEGDAKLHEAQKLMQQNLAEASKEAVAEKGKQDAWRLLKTTLADQDLAPKLKKALQSQNGDGAFTAAALKALGALLDARIAEEKKKDGGGRSKQYLAAKDALDQFLSKEVQFKAGTPEADVIKAWSDRLDTAIEQSDKTMKAAEDRAEVMKNWLGRVEAAFTASVRGPDARSEKDYRTLLDVFDDVLRELEYSRVLATRAGNDEHVKQIDRAITYARARRATLLYVRPASIYLRDSYPATVLQQSPADSGAVPNLIWRKLATAFVNETTTEDLAVKEQIDKQFWQTINQVRLGGGGTTNYVVAKDDLGNWYVKGYENDLKSIINSVRGLAMFAAGAKLQSSLFNKPPAADDLSTQRTPFEKQVDKSTGDYRDEMQKVVENARAEVSNLQQSYRGEYDKLQLSDDGKKLLDASREKVFPAPSEVDIKFSLDPAGDDKKTARALHDELRKLLEKTLAYFSKVRAKLVEAFEAGKKSGGKISDEDPRTVTKALWQVTRKSVDQSIAASEKAGTKLDSRIALISDLLDAATTDAPTAK